MSRSECARAELKKRVSITRNVAKKQGYYPKFRAKYVQMMKENYGFNAAFGIGRVPKKRRG